ncbi:MAG: serine/threonine protein kinase [Planctomycetes bacterium]|nr:serine/threonine protein kinase [Planctomycetota bacterium]
MNGADFQILEAAFERVRELPPSEAASLLEQLSEDRPEVAARLKRMLSVKTSAPTVRTGPSLRDEHTRRIGAFRVLGTIGSGAHGVVYLGQQSHPIHRLVAIKVLHPSRATPDNLRRFELEQQILATLDHPGIVSVVQSGHDELGMPYLAMPLVAGVPITQYCLEEKLGPDECVELLIQVCHAVQHAHARGVIHRDIKPGNIIVGKLDQAPLAKVIDFGVAKVAGTHSSMTETGQRLGTVRYMAPEQFHGTDPTVQNDVFGLGAVLYETMTQEPVWGHVQDEGMLLGLIHSGPKWSESAFQRVPIELRWITQKALECDPARRYTTVQELCADLERYRAGASVQAGPPARWHRMWRWVKNHRAVATLSAIAVIATMVGMFVSIRFGLAEHRSRVRAERLSAFATDFFGRLDPYQAMGKDRTLMLGALRDAALRLQEERADSEVRREYSGLLGRAFVAIGEHAQALPLLEEAEQLTRDASDETRYLTLAALMRVHNEADEEHLGKPYSSELVRLSQGGEARRVLEARLLDQQASKSELRKVEQLAREVESVLGPFDILTIAAHRQVARSAFVDDAACALGILRDMRGRAAAIFGSDHPLVYEEIALEAWGILKMDGPECVVEFSHEHLAAASRALGPLHRTVILLRGNMAEGLSQLGQHGAAEAEAMRAQLDALARGGPLDFVTVAAIRGRVEVLIRSLKGDEAVAAMRQLDRDAGSPREGDYVKRTEVLLERLGRTGELAAWREEVAKRPR